MKKITVFITHSFGELDILMPLFYEINNQQKVKIKIIITIKKIHEKLQSNQFFQELIHYLNIKVVNSPLFNKVNYNNNHFINRNTNLVQRYFNINNKFLEPFKYFRFIFKSYLSLKLFIKNLSIIFSNIVMFEITNQIRNDLNYFLLNNIFKKKLIIYNHGHTINTLPIINPRKLNDKNNNFSKKETEEIKQLENEFFQHMQVTSQRNTIRSKKENSTFLLYHQQNEDWARHAGFNRFHLLGFPKYFKEWMKFIKKETKFDIKGKYVVIFSRQLSKYFMDKKNYEYLFKSSIEILKEKLPSYKIYIKIHPRENTDILKSLILKYDVKNIEITDIYSLILSKNAFLIISFYTSAILDSLALKIPSVEFYIETEKFKIVEPKGSPFKYSGIDTVDSKHLLREFVERRINGKYKIPEFANKMSATKDLSIFFD